MLVSLSLFLVGLCQFVAPISLSLTGEVPDNDAMEFQQDGLGPSMDVSPVYLEDQEGEIPLNIDRTPGVEDLTTHCEQNDLLRVR